MLFLILLKNKSFLFIVILISFQILYNGNAKAQDSLAKKPKIGLVLSGGGAKGFAHIGVIRVLEQAGVEIDFIGGTSMGSIIGGLYAIGYSIDDIDSLARSQNWDELVQDEMNRKILAVDEKDNEKYVLSFPVRDKKIMLPAGLSDGQNISTLLSRLTIDVHDERDFSKFTIPFICVAADIESGKAVVIDTGYIADAMRASMAIPSAFAPYEIGGRLYVDGGLINNYPATAVKNMGADILIGVDVQSPYKKKNEISSMVDVLDQASRFLRSEYNNKNRKLTDILIQPDMKGYGVFSFDDIDTIIKLGEIEAEKYLSEFNKMIDSLQIGSLKIKQRQTLEFQDTVYINGLEIIGLKKVPMEFVIGKVSITIPGKIAVEDINRTINKIYASRYFEHVSFITKSHETGRKLIIKLKEKSYSLIRLGIHYDNNNKAALLLNATRYYRKNASKLSIDLKLGENPGLLANYILDRGWKPGLAFKLEANYSEMFEYTGRSKSASYNYSNIMLDAYIQSVFGSSVAIGFGFQGELSSINNKVNPINFDNITETYLNYFFYLKADTYDKSVYPTKGILFKSEMKVITQDGNIGDKEQNSTSLKFDIAKATPFGKRFSLITRIYGGALFGDRPPNEYWFYMGGIGENYIKCITPFIGMHYMETSGKKIIVGRIDAQLELWKDIYLIGKGNIGKNTLEFEEIFNNNSYLYGYGGTIGYNSVVGPIEITVMASNVNQDIVTYLNMGFWF